MVAGPERGWDRAVAALRERTVEGATVWSLDTAIVVQAGRRVPPGFEPAEGPREASCPTGE